MRSPKETEDRITELIQKIEFGTKMITELKGKGEFSGYLELMNDKYQTEKKALLWVLELD